MVAIIEKIIPHKIVDEYKACKKLFFQKHASMIRVIEAIGILYINGNQQIVLVEGIINKTTKTILATKNTNPAESNDIIVLEFFLNLKGDTFFSFSSIKVFRETSNILDSLTMTSKSGKLSPLSHFEIDLSLYCSFSASSSCVIFADNLNFVKFLEIMSFISFIKV